MTDDPTPDPDELVARITHARARRESAQAALDEAHRAYLGAVVQAYRVFGATELARRLEISRGRVYQLLEGQARRGRGVGTPYIERHSPLQLPDNPPLIHSRLRACVAPFHGLTGRLNSGSLCLHGMNMNHIRTGDLNRSPSLWL